MKIPPHMIANFNTSTDKRNNVTQFCTGPKSRLDLRGGREVKCAFFQGGRFSAFECRSKKEFLMIVCHVWRQLQKLANAKGKFTFDATKSCSSPAGKYNGKTPMYSDDEQTAIKTDSVFRTFVSSDADFKSITQDKQVREHSTWKCW